MSNLTRISVIWMIYGHRPASSRAYYTHRPTAFCFSRIQSGQIPTHENLRPPAMESNVPNAQLSAHTGIFLCQWLITTKTSGKSNTDTTLSYETKWRYRNFLWFDCIGDIGLNLIKQQLSIITHILTIIL